MLFHQVNDLEQLLRDLFIIFTAVGNQATGAILDPIFGICKTTAAPIPQRIQRAIAKQATEAFRICIPVTGKILTLLILKKIVIGHKTVPFFLKENMV